MLVSLVLAALLAQAAPPAAPVNTVRQLRLENTRLSRLGVARLSELLAGTAFDDAVLQKAVAKVVASGLVRGAKIQLQPMPDRDTEVIVTFHMEDEPANGRAVLQFPKIKEAAAWRALEEANELITPELPLNDKAIAYYTQWIETYLDKDGAPGFLKTNKVVAERNGNQVVFKAAKR